MSRLVNADVVLAGIESAQHVAKGPAHDSIVQTRLRHLHASVLQQAKGIDETPTLREALTTKIIDTLRDPDGAGSDLGVGDFDEPWLEVRGNLDVQHLVSDVIVAISQHFTVSRLADAIGDADTHLGDCPREEHIIAAEAVVAMLGSA